MICVLFQLKLKIVEKRPSKPRRVILEHVLVILAFYSRFKTRTRVTHARTLTQVISPPSCT